MRRPGWLSVGGGGGWLLLSGNGSTLQDGDFFDADDDRGDDTLVSKWTRKHYASEEMIFPPPLHSLPMMIGGVKDCDGNDSKCCFTVKMPVFLETLQPCQSFGFDTIVISKISNILSQIWYFVQFCKLKILKIWKQVNLARSVKIPNLVDEKDLSSGQ